MGDKSKIEWCDASWNPVRGCSLVSAGCTNCYAMREAHRLKPYHGLTRMTEHGPVWTGEVRLVPELLDQPLRWKRPRRIFVNSMSDLFHEKVPFDFIDRVFSIVELSPQHMFQLLTKRPQRMLEWFNYNPKRLHPKGALIECTEARVGALCIKKGRDLGENVDAPNWDLFFAWPPANVWLGVSVEDQKTADERIPLLIQTPAAVRWISAEPLLGPIDLDGEKIEDLHALGCGYSGCKCGNRGLDWVVVGGESGARARPMHPDWARSIREQCQTAGVPFFFKQWGEWAPSNAEVRNCSTDRIDVGNVIVSRVGKKAAGRLLDGREWSEYPEAK